MPATVLAQTTAETDWLADAAQVAQLATDNRPTLQDTQRVYRFLKAIAAGNYIDVSAKIAGFAKQTIYDWREYAKAGELAAIRMMDFIEKAEAQAEGEMVDCVRNAAKSGPQYWAAGMTYLERRQPDRWGKRQDDSSAPKVIVQIGVSQGDVSVQLGPSPSTSLQESEALQIQAINSPESDKQGYVNRAKLLTGETIDMPQGRESEVPSGPVPAVDPAGDPTRVRAVSGRKGFARSKGTRDKKRTDGSRPR
jgi:hypothetical protein